MLPIALNTHVPMPFHNAGVALYNDGNMDNADAYVTEAHTFDTCYGHVSPNPEGLYQ